LLSDQKKGAFEQRFPSLLHFLNFHTYNYTAVGADYGGDTTFRSLHFVFLYTKRKQERKKNKVKQLDSLLCNLSWPYLYPHPPENLSLTSKALQYILHLYFINNKCSHT